MNLIDTHCHVYATAFDIDRREVVERAIEEGVQRFLLPNIDLASIEPLLQLTNEYPERCMPMMGLHPCHVRETWQSECDAIEQVLDAHPCVAVGEIGMDLFRGRENRNFQIFQRIIFFYYYRRWVK